MSELGRALIDQLDAEDIARLAERLQPFLPERQQQPPRAAYTVPSLAAEIARSQKSIRAAIQRGELKAAKRGRGYVISAEAIIEWTTPTVASQKRRLPPEALRAPAAAGPTLREAFRDLEMER